MKKRREQREAEKEAMAEELEMIQRERAIAEAVELEKKEEEVGGLWRPAGVHLLSQWLQTEERVVLAERAARAVQVHLAQGTSTHLPQPSFLPPLLCLLRSSIWSKPSSARSSALPPGGPRRLTSWCTGCLCWRTLSPSM